MPMRIDHIDAIARKLKRDALLISFHLPAPANRRELPLTPVGPTAWQSLPVRQQIIAWLEEHRIAWKPCGDFAGTEFMGSYRGQIYVDLPWDESLPAYKALEAYLQSSDDSMRFPEATFQVCMLEDAMRNEAHDEPGFWERRAEDE